MNKQMQLTVKKAKAMNLAKAQAMIHHHNQLSDADRLRWLGCDTERYDMNLSILEAAREIVDRQAT